MVKVNSSMPQLKHERGRDGRIMSLRPARFTKGDSYSKTITRSHTGKLGDGRVGYGAPVILVPKLTQEDGQFKASMGYLGSCMRGWTAHKTLSGRERWI